MSEPAYYVIRNWSQFQHYKDRAPAWIKLHFALLASDDWVMLDDASRLLAVVCMLVASRNSGRVPNKPAYLKRIAYLDQQPDLGPLISSGFLSEPLAEASAVQADAPKRLSREEERREEREEPNGSLPETRISGQPKPVRKRQVYPADFEAAWKAYPTSRNMSKFEALAPWRKLDPAERAQVLASIPSYIALLKSKPDLEPLHFCRYLSKRRFEGHVPGRGETQETDWPKRLAFARDTKTWSTPQWGPMPGQPGCEVPPDQMQPGDGQGWTERLRRAA